MAVRSLIFDDEPLLPDRSSYNVVVAYGAKTTDIGLGPRRVGGTTLNNSITQTVTYTLDACQTQYFMDLYYGELLEGQLPLRILLEVSGSDLSRDRWYIATIVGAPTFPTYTGIVNQVSVSYNLVPDVPSV